MQSKCKWSSYTYTYIRLHALVCEVAMCVAVNIALHYSFENASYWDGENEKRINRVLDYTLSFETLVVISSINRYLLSIGMNFSAVSWNAKYCRHKLSYPRRCWRKRFHPAKIIIRSKLLVVQRIVTHFLSTYYIPPLPHVHFSITDFHLGTD